jgi:hypothetical protein
VQLSHIVLLIIMALIGIDALCSRRKLKQAANELKEEIRNLNRKDATWRLIELNRWISHLGKAMPGEQAVHELCHIHALYMVPIWLGRGEILYKITRFLAHSAKLEPSHAQQLANMLLWEEIRVFQGASCIRNNIITALQQITTPSILPQLKEHEKFLEKKRDGMECGSHEYADLAASEIPSLKKLIKMCEEQG